MYKDHTHSPSHDGINLIILHYLTPAQYATRHKAGIIPTKKTINGDVHFLILADRVIGVCSTAHHGLWSPCT